MTPSYSDELPSFKKDQPDEEEELRGHERFGHWVEEGFAEGGRREPGPLLRMGGLLVIILCLAWSASRPSGLKRVLVKPGHARFVLPIGIVGGEAPSWTEANVLAAVDEVRPPAKACLEGWDGVVTNDDGMVVGEVVLTPTGPEEAALYDQVDGVPVAVADCLGRALGSVSWPLPETVESLPFPIVGGDR